MKDYERGEEESWPIPATAKDGEVGGSGATQAAQKPQRDPGTLPRRADRSTKATASAPPDGNRGAAKPLPSSDAPPKRIDPSKESVKARSGNNNVTTGRGLKSEDESQTVAASKKDGNDQSVRKKDMPQVQQEDVKKNIQQGPRGQGARAPSGKKNVEQDNPREQMTLENPQSKGESDPPPVKKVRTLKNDIKKRVPPDIPQIDIQDPELQKSKKKDVIGNDVTLLKSEMTSPDGLNEDVERPLPQKRKKPAAMEAKPNVNGENKPVEDLHDDIARTGQRKEKKAAGERTSPDGLHDDVEKPLPQKRKKPAAMEAKPNVTEGNKPLEDLHDDIARTGQRKEKKAAGERTSPDGLHDDVEKPLPQKRKKPAAMEAKPNVTEGNKPLENLHDDIARTGQRKEKKAAGERTSPDDLHDDVERPLPQKRKKPAAMEAKPNVSGENKPPEDLHDDIARTVQQKGKKAAGQNVQLNTDEKKGLVRDPNDNIAPATSPKRKKPAMNSDQAPVDKRTSKDEQNYTSKIQRLLSTLEQNSDTGLTTALIRMSEDPIKRKEMENFVKRQWNNGAANDCEPQNATKTSFVDSNTSVEAKQKSYITQNFPYGQDYASAGTQTEKHNSVSTSRFGSGESSDRQMDKLRNMTEYFPRDERYYSENEHSSFRAARPIIREEGPVLREERLSPREERPIPRDERPIPQDERSIPQEERSIPSDERLIPRDERLIPRDERPIPREGNSIFPDERPIPWDQQSSLREERSLKNDDYRDITLFSDDVSQRRNSVSESLDRVSAGRRNSTRMQDDLDTGGKGNIPSKSSYVPRSQRTSISSDGKDFYKPMRKWPSDKITDPSTSEIPIAEVENRYTFDDVDGKSEDALTIRRTKQDSQMVSESIVNQDRRSQETEPGNTAVKSLEETWRPSMKRDQSLNKPTARPSSWRSQTVSAPFVRRVSLVNYIEHPISDSPTGSVLSETLRRKDPAPPPAPRTLQRTSVTSGGTSRRPSATPLPAYFSQRRPSGASIGQLPTYFTQRRSSMASSIGTTPGRSSSRLPDYLVSSPPSTPAPDPASREIDDSECSTLFSTAEADADADTLLDPRYRPAKSPAHSTGYHHTTSNFKKPRTRW